MLRLKVTLKSKKKVVINTNYRSRLNMLCKELIKFNRERYVYKVSEKKESEQLYFSPLFCKKYEVSGGKIIFKEDINWYITCSSYDTILDLIQGFYCKNIIKLGKAELEVVSMELSNVEKINRTSVEKRNSFLSDTEAKENNEIAIMQ